jgi:hypothetical protein
MARKSIPYTKNLTSVREFSTMIAKREAKSKQVNIAQINEILRVIRILLRRGGVDIYKVIGSTPKEIFNGK